MSRPDHPHEIDHTRKGNPLILSGLSLGSEANSIFAPSERVMTTTLNDIWKPLRHGLSGVRRHVPNCEKCGTAFRNDTVKTEGTLCPDGEKAKRELFAAIEAALEEGKAFTN